MLKPGDTIGNEPADHAGVLFFDVPLIFLFQPSEVYPLRSKTEEHMFINDLAGSENFFSCNGKITAFEFR
jgi:hypothetical protein